MPSGVRFADLFSYFQKKKKNIPRTRCSPFNGRGGPDPVKSWTRCSPFFGKLQTVFLFPNKMGRFATRARPIVNFSFFRKLPIMKRPPTDAHLG